MCVACVLGDVNVEIIIAKQTQIALLDIPSFILSRRQKLRRQKTSSKQVISLSPQKGVNWDFTPLQLFVYYLLGGRGSLGSPASEGGEGRRGGEARPSARRGAPRGPERRAALP
jgi:hypothetical protein